MTREEFYSALGFIGDNWTGDDAHVCHEAIARIRELEAAVAERDEAVKVLAKNYNDMEYLASHGDYANGVTDNCGLDEGDAKYVDEMERIAKAINDNPIARAAVDAANALEGT